ncbi:hypothetical protein HELRODRAFT_171218 [Helobdella robusta]|uniref:NAD(P)(+)--arginine ADP-ribosyltransferase n=1 Tax=Helobdella robusta TaxID=6412 RepID=T1F3Y5_HELRO|nr:hypothetical protein HELRODRAFT_171218 [Helobdella robusta]ESO05574.1 hypothetical protein HELRODRAFT_171218 [Helobdella robusta]
MEEIVEAAITSTGAAQKPKGEMLDVFRRDDPNFDKFQKWYCEIANTKFKDENDELKQLKEEACRPENAEKKRPNQSTKTMCESYDVAAKKYEKLTEDQKVISAGKRYALTMYSTTFANKFNADLRKDVYVKIMISGKFDQYRVFNALLLQALQSLQKPLKTTFLFRGLTDLFTLPDNKSFFFKTFTSTTPDSTVANKFISLSGRPGTRLQFNVTEAKDLVGAEIIIFSEFSKENEVLLSPFNEFKLDRQDKSTLFMSYPKDQYFRNYKC